MTTPRTQSQPPFGERPPVHHSLGMRPVSFVGGQTKDHPGLCANHRPLLASIEIREGPCTRGHEEEGTSRA